MNCRQCAHYGFYRMITDGPYGYAGKIPCLTCKHLDWQEDNFTPIGITIHQPTSYSAAIISNDHKDTGHHG